MRVLVSLALSFLLIGSTARAFTYNPGDLLVMLNTQGSALTMNLGPVSALANGTANLQDTTAEWSSNQFTASAVFSAGASNGSGLVYALPITFDPATQLKNTSPIGLGSANGLDSFGKTLTGVVGNGGPSANPTLNNSSPGNLAIAGPSAPNLGYVFKFNPIFSNAADALFNLNTTGVTDGEVFNLYDAVNNWNGTSTTTLLGTLTISDPTGHGIGERTLVVFNTAVPEPGTVMLLGFGIFALAWQGGRRRIGRDRWSIRISSTARSLPWTKNLR